MLIPVNDSRHEFHIVHWTLNPIRKQSIPPIAFIPLKHQWPYLARTLIIVAPRVHRWVSLLVALLPPTASMRTSKTRKATSRERFPSQYQLEFYMSCDLRICCLGVIRDKDLTSSSGGTPRTTAIVYIVDPNANNTNVVTHT